MKKYTAEGHTHVLTDIIDFELNEEVKKEIRLKILYSDIEYIKPNGNCYIDTGFTPNQDTRIVTRVKVAHDSDNEFLFGVRSGVSSNTFCFSNYTSSKCRTHYYKTYLDFDIAHEDEIFIIDKNKNITIIGDNVIEHSYENFTCPDSLYLFCVNTNGEIENYSSAIIYSMQIYDNDTLVRDYVPIFHNLKDEYGLYDKVNDRFYGGQGSGKLIGGNFI